MTDREKALAALDRFAPIINLLSEKMAKLPTVEADGFSIVQHSPFLITICSSITDMDALTHRVNHQIHQGMASLRPHGIDVPEEHILRYIPYDQGDTIPSGDPAVVPCGEAEAKHHRIFRLDHPLFEAAWEVGRQTNWGDDL